MVTKAEQGPSKTFPHNGALQSLLRHPIPSVAVSLLMERVYFGLFNNGGSSSVNDQLDAQFFYYIIRLLQSSTCFEQRRVHHAEVNCINTASGIVTLFKWPSGAPDGHLQRVTIPDAVLIQFDLLMTSTTLPETCTGL